MEGSTSTAALAKLAARKRRFELRQANLAAAARNGPPRTHSSTTRV